MKITYKDDYALNALLELAVHYGSDVLTSAELAERLDIPFKFLEQILLELKKGGFVESRRGKVGGYLLARPPDQIKLGDVIRFINGPLSPISCVEPEYSGCLHQPRCVLRPLWQQVEQATARILDGVTFADLAERVKTRKPELTYSI